MKTTTIQKWGNSYAVRIPIEAIEELSLKEGQPVTIERVGRGLSIKPSLRTTRSLKEMLARVSPESIHNETDWGTTFGREIW